MQIKRLKLLNLSKKGGLERVALILILVILLFSIVNGILSFAETSEDKSRLETELKNFDEVEL